jgi:preprotein translocase subunit SecB
MADKDSKTGKAEGADNGARSDSAAPTVGPIAGADSARLSVLAQYVKDLSFENPDGPKAFGPAGQGPKINVGINVTATRLTPTESEVAIKLEATAKDEQRTLFAAELVYAGMFRFTNIPEAQIEALAMIECARLLFPFARQILAEATRNGGFPPLLIDPVDFAGMYRDRSQRRVPGTAGAPTMPPPSNLS